MTVTGGNQYSPEMNPTHHDCSRNERYRRKLLLAVKGKPMRHEYGTMTMIRLLDFMYENKNKTKKNIFCVISI